MTVRRVVTGHDAEGRAVVVDDSKVEPVTAALLPGAAYHRVWGGDTRPSFPDDGSQPPHHYYFPPVEGFRFGLFTVPPASAPRTAPVDLQAGFIELEQKLPGLLTFVEADSPAMHTTPTIDFEYVVSGEVWLELDEGVEVHLRAGDVVVQNGTRHAWHNHGDVPAVVVVCMIGAEHGRFHAS